MKKSRPGKSGRLFLFFSEPSRNSPPPTEGCPIGRGGFGASSDQRGGVMIRETSDPEMRGSTRRRLKTFGYPAEKHRSVFLRTITQQSPSSEGCPIGRGGFGASSDQRGGVMIRETSDPEMRGSRRRRLKTFYQSRRRSGRLPGGGSTARFSSGPSRNSPPPSEGCPIGRGGFGASSDRRGGVMTRETSDPEMRGSTRRRLKTFYQSRRSRRRRLKTFGYPAEGTPLDPQPPPPPPPKRGSGAGSQRAKQGARQGPMLGHIAAYIPAPRSG